MNNVSRKAQEWGKKKFVPKTKNRAPKPYLREEPATPWNVFKNEMIEKDQEEKRASSLNIESEEAKKIFKQRGENYRKMLIIEKQKEPTKWEKFEEDQTAGPSKKNEKPDTGGKKQKKKTSTAPGGSRPIVSGETLKNFDNRKLNFKQNNYLRKTITAGHLKMSGSNLDSMINAFKKKKELQTKINNEN